MYRSAPFLPFGQSASLSVTAFLHKLRSATGSFTLRCASTNTMIAGNQRLGSCTLPIDPKIGNSYAPALLCTSHVSEYQRYSSYTKGMSESETSRAVIYWLLINTDTQPKVSSVVGKVLCIGCETSQTEVPARNPCNKFLR